MPIAILTVDQRGSRSGPDLVPEVLEALNSPDLGTPARAFERTAGDEVQGVLADGAAVVRRIELLLRRGEWNVGLGLGDVEEPLPPSTRAGRGEAFVLARQAVTRAKQHPSRLAVTGSGVVGDGQYRADQIETIAWLWAGVLTRRSVRGWEVADLLAGGISHAEAAHRLGISQSAVSQRAQAAGLVEADRAAELLTELIDQVLTGEERR
ncbi:transposase [Nocardioides marmorisolisilvae]|uniref:Transposase n=1 Tax=Nocardioides marmorisolisilvae TaxID=1542737 RepID=A0A3N0DVZ7_9ACTN|nr:transposase [Nocardioides marmorisolisilvae]RNL79790.1 transposase [Nocardioides marmorisolisilvae]